ncbi:MAG: hypothetical protein IKS51_05510 [Erysipelotrichaceae bacterium]|nr:hypothetical protein [Erysipelotrichaceae bacterium]
MKQNKILPPVYLILLLITIVLLGMTTISGARATLSVNSEEYVSNMQVRKMGIAIYDVPSETILAEKYFAEGAWQKDGEGKVFTDISGEGFIIGKRYDENVTVANVGTMAEYVRVVVYKYWVDSQGNKRTDLDPELIHIVFDDEAWYLDESSVTEERSILYYRGILDAPEEDALSMTPSFVHSVMLDDGIRSLYISRDGTDENGNPIIEYIYDYDGMHFIIEIEADSVQTHNALDSIKSAWGVSDETDAGKAVLEALGVN